MRIWFLHPLRVRYQETDQMRVVYHANYLNWFEIGRTEWVRHAGFSYRELEQRGLLLPVTRVEASFMQPAMYDDWVTVCTHLEEVTPVRMKFQSRVMRGDLTKEHGFSLAADEPPGEMLVSGSTNHVWVGEAMKPVRLAREAPEFYEKIRALYERGVSRI